MKRTYVKPAGNIDAKLAICGEQPGKQEVLTNKPFVGPAGNGLNECLTMVKIGRSQLYLTNVIKDLDKPLAAYINIKSNGTWTISEEGYQYIKELGEELKSLNLNVIVACGNIALIALTNRVGITKWRGSVVESTLVPGLKVVPTFHPATFIKPKFNFLNKPLICEDLRRADYESGFPEIRRKPRHLIIAPNFEESVAALDYCYEVGKKGQTIAIDIEVINKELDCISFGWAEDQAISIPFRDHRGDYFTVEQEHEIMLLIAKIIQSPDIVKSGANFIFDLQFLFNKYGIKPRGITHCTQIAQKISFPDFPAGLDFVTNMYTDIPYYKDDGKQWMKMGAGSWDEWWTYSAMDAIVPSEALPKQLRTLRKQQNAETYERQRKLIEPLIYMSERGIKVDVDGMLKCKETEQSELDSLAEELNREVGYEINYNSSYQIMNYFYNELGITPYKNRKTGKPSSDINALKRISRRGYKAAQILLKIRGLSKRISTYLNIEKVDKDGRMRSSYKPVGAETGRLSSGTTIFGTGGNQQNIPHDILRFFMFDEGYLGYSIDLSQIENRIVAYVGGVITQIEAFEKGIDLHRLSASIVFQKPYDEISDKDGSSSLGDGRQSERYWGKKCKLSSTEVLTPNGWIPIEYAKHHNMKIAQWEKSGTVTFVTPLDWFEDIYTGDIITIENQRIFQEATPDHKMPLYYNGSVIDKKLIDYPKSGKYSSPLSGNLISEQSIPDPLIRLLVAFQADGHWQGNGIGFRLQKQRKINRIKAILELASVEYSDNPSGIYISTKHDLCKFTYLMLGRDKLFGPWLLNLDQASLLTFIDELPHWDGSIDRKKRLYFTTVKRNAEWVQTIAHLCGKAANISRQFNKETSAFGDEILYRVSIRDTVAPATSAVRRSIRGVTNEKIFCPTVPSGYFLVKEKEKISVTGNSNHATNYDIGYKTFALVNELTEAEAKYTLEKIHRGYPQIRGGYHVVIQEMLKENRTIVNPFGRTRLFLGPIVPSYPNVPASACYNTYRDAYAHLPQSTTADKINEQGIIHTYYNQQLFSSVELLTQIHDSIVFQIPLSEPFEEHARIVLDIKQSLEQPLYWKGKEIPTPADISIGLNMSKKYMKEIKSKDCPTSIPKMAEKIKETYNDLKQTQL